MRESGILCPIFSLSSRYGIGCFSKEAFDFIDFLYSSGQGFWQILPIGPTGYGDSPYQPISAFAGNPYFISPEGLIEDNYLTYDECTAFDFGNFDESVDYEKLYYSRIKLLKIAFSRFKVSENFHSTEYRDFIQKEKFWLEDYALYMALKEENNGSSWESWDNSIKLRKKEAMEDAKIRLCDAINFFYFTQYMFSKQWNKLKKYASEKNIKIIGDIPFYVSMDSSDVWSHPEVFSMDKNLTPTAIAGCPPDTFSSLGQLWGNPIYNWTYLKKTDYYWWVKRIQRSLSLFDSLRIDHFHGFSEYYSIPYGEENAVNGKLKKGPGKDFFDILKKRIGECTETGFSKIIAEDLGNVTKENQRLLDDINVPGMKILQYAFTSWDSIYMPYKYDKNCVVYTGTHDNMTTKTWLETINDAERDYLRRYLNSYNTDFGALVWDLIREAYRSVSDLCIIPIQDYLVKGNEARINTPGSPDNNWQWRLKPNFLSFELSHSIRLLAETYGRIPKSKN